MVMEEKFQKTQVEQMLEEQEGSFLGDDCVKDIY